MQNPRMSKNLPLLSYLIALSIVCAPKAGAQPSDEAVSQLGEVSEAVAQPSDLEPSPPPELPAPPEAVQEGAIAEPPPGPAQPAAPAALGTGGPAPAAGSLDFSTLRSSELRDPFWPVGYAPPLPEPALAPGVSRPGAAVAPTVEGIPRWDEALKTLVVKGVMKTGPTSYVTIINDQVVKEKETVSTSFSGRKYTWTVKSISDRGISFERQEPAD